MTKLSSNNIVVFGINSESVASHQNFAQRERLNFALLSDTSKQTLRQYGVLGQNGLPQRVTMIVGPDGTIRAIDGTVNSQFTGKTADGARISQHGENLTLLLSDWNGKVGTRVPNFFLPDLDGKTISPMRPEGKATVIVFVSSNDSASRAQMHLLTKLATNPIYHAVSFLAIAASDQETNEQLKAFAESCSLTFPVARDRFNEVSGRMGITVTPSVWVMSSKGVVVYRGALTSIQRGGASINYVKEALDAVLTGRPVPVAETSPTGTRVMRPNQPP